MSPIRPPLIAVRLRTQVEAVEAEGGQLAAITIGDAGGKRERIPVTSLFLCIRGVRRSGWAAGSRTELVGFLEKLGDLGRPGATLMTSFICRSAGYTVQQREFPAFAVDETTIFEYLERAGLELEDVEVRSVASEDPASNPGYEGLLFVAGRLPG